LSWFGTWFRSACQGNRLTQNFHITYVVGKQHYEFCVQPEAFNFGALVVQVHEQLIKVVRAINVRMRVETSHHAPCARESASAIFDVVGDRQRAAMY
jgi:hypothetical protein